jgi:broad specificity phosphatase PhoE
MQVLSGPTELVLVRHAESRGNVADREARLAKALRLQLDVRDADMPLSDLGVQQAQALGRHLRSQPPHSRPTAVLSSPYARAASTARTIVATADLDLEVELDERVRERELGAFDGLTGDGIRRLHPDEAGRRRWVGKFLYRPPSGESWADVVLRVRQLMLNISLAPDAYERIWVVTHQAVILAFRMAMEGLTEAEILEIDRGQPLPNCSTTRYRSGPCGGWQLVAFADPGPIEGVAPETHERPVSDRGPEDAASRS